MNLNDLKSTTKLELDKGESKILEKNWGVSEYLFATLFIKQCHLHKLIFKPIVFKLKLMPLERHVVTNPF